MLKQVALDGPAQGLLKIGERLVAVDGRQAEFDQHSRDVHVLAFDRARRAANPFPQGGVVVGLDVGTTGKLVGEHGEIISDDGVELVRVPVSSYPRLVCHSPHLPEVRRE